MDVIKQFPEDMDARTAYKLMKSPEVKKMSEAEGSILQVASWIQYNSPDKETGEVKEVIAIETVDGELFATISNTFREEFLDIEKKMEEILSDLEWRVLMSYLDGKSYQEIAEDLHRHVKSIDNALQRVKRKLEKYMENRGDDLDISTVYRGLSSINRRLRGVMDDGLQD